MKKTLLAMSAVAAVCAALPASAQYYSRPATVDASFDARLDAMRARLDAGIRQGTITRREAWPLQRRLSDLQRLEARYSVNGFTRFERDDLRRRLGLLRQDLRVADAGAYDRYDRYADYDSGYYGTGGPYEDSAIVCERRSGVGGLVDSLTGRSNCYAVGQRVGAGLDAVPYGYRDRYKDGSGVYYRSDGRSIYEIDARTNMVLRIHPRD
jgi:hypothetical protein